MKGGRYEAHGDELVRVSYTKTAKETQAETTEEQDSQTEEKPTAGSASANAKTKKVNNDAGK